MNVGDKGITRSAYGGALAVLACAIAIGCGSSDEPLPSTSGAQEELDGATFNRSSRSATEILHSLFERMDAVGPGSEESQKAELRDFLNAERPMEALRKTYEAMPKSALGNRWRAIYVAGQIKSADSIAFLEQVALSAPEIDPAAVGEHAGDQGFRLRYTAAVGIVHALKGGVRGADSSLDAVLKSADPEVAQLAGVELFSAGKLTDRHRKALRDRGIAADFRRLTEAEHRERFTQDPSLTPHQGESMRTRPLSTSVPAMEEVQ
jgi:hypothetical protein